MIILRGIELVIPTVYSTPIQVWHVSLSQQFNRYAICTNISDVQTYVSHRYILYTYSPKQALTQAVPNLRNPILRLSRSVRPTDKAVPGIPKHHSRLASMFAAGHPHIWASQHCCTHTHFKILYRLLKGTLAPNFTHSWYLA